MMMRGVFYRESVVVFFYAAASIVEEAIYLFFFPLFSLSFFLILFLASEAEGVKERSQKHYKLRNFRGDFWVRERERERNDLVRFGQCSFSGLTSIEHEGKTFGVARTEARAINIRQSCGPPFNAKSISSPGRNTANTLQKHYC